MSRAQLGRGLEQQGLKRQRIPGAYNILQINYNYLSRSRLVTAVHKAAVRRRLEAKAFRSNCRITIYPLDTSASTATGSIRGEEQTQSIVLRGGYERRGSVKSARLWPNG